MLDLPPLPDQFLLTQRSYSKRMNFFKKLIGRITDAAPGASAPSPNEGEPIRAYDKYGRELLIPRGEWLKVLKDNLQQVWQKPDELAGHVIQALQDGFDAEIEDAARQLQRIDPNKERGSTLLAIVYLQTNRPAEAQALLLEHIRGHGENGVILTNLAKAQSALGEEAQALATLWHALELDPNQDNGMGWYEVIHREKCGEQGGLDALHRIASLPGSWRAQLWIARHELSQRRLDEALALYQQALDHAPRPVPGDLLMQLSGDLGNAGHLLPLLDLTAPHFDIRHHGLQVGNNLIKAAIDTGQLDRARELLDQHQALQRPDWRENLGVWEAELQKARIATADPVSREELRCAMLTIHGPLWLPDDHPIRSHFPPKSGDSPDIVLIGSTYESPHQGSEVQIGPTNNTGRYSRALPLLFAEHLHLRGPFRTTVLVPWILNGFGGFALSGKPYDDEAIVEQARQVLANSPHPADYALYSHLVVRGENISLQLRLFRCIDGRRIAESIHPFPEAGFHKAADEVFAALAAMFEKETEIVLDSARPTPEGPELDHYLLRLEQALAVNCSTMEESNPEFLSNPSEILDGMLHLCLQNPQHLPSRMLLLRTLRKLRTSQPGLTTAIRPKVESLLDEFPLAVGQTELTDELRALFADTNH
jgi:tetratricopeptide (TPR) repeat protein